MAKLFVHIYVETQLGERPIEYQQVRNELLVLPADVDDVKANLDELIDQAHSHLLLQVRQLARAERAHTSEIK